MTPAERTAAADWIEARHLAGELRGMSMDQVVAMVWTELGLDVDRGQVFGAIMEAGSRRGRREAMARIGNIAQDAADKPLFALVPIAEVAPMVHEDED